MAYKLWRWGFFSASLSVTRKTWVQQLFSEHMNTTILIIWARHSPHCLPLLPHPPQTALAHTAGQWNNQVLGLLSPLCQAQEQFYIQMHSPQLGNCRSWVLISHKIPVFQDKQVTNKILVKINLSRRFCNVWTHMGSSWLSSLEAFEGQDSCLEQEKIVQWVGCFPCMRLSWFQSLASHKVPWTLSGAIYKCRARSNLWGSLGVTPKQTKLKKESASNFYHHCCEEQLTLWGTLGG